MENRRPLDYEALYDRLLERGETLHRSNQKRIRIGLIFLAVFTVGMILVRWATGSDRVVFMVLWVVGMFAASIYLISVEYIDSSLQKTLEEVTERETEFGELLPDTEEVREKIYERISEIQTEHRSRLHGGAAAGVETGVGTGAAAGAEAGDSGAAPEAGSEEGGVER